MKSENVGKWLAADRVGTSPSGKTNIWLIWPRKDKPGDSPDEHAFVELGRVRWTTTWRCYAFYPEPGSWYEADCLRALAAFCETKTRKHKRRK